jgi:nucleoside-diphosphate-sugar epimerase
MRTILVTGGAGYVGSVLVPKMLLAGYRVKVLDLFIYGDNLPNDFSLEKIKGDIRDLDTVNEVLEGCDTVIHLACISNDPSFDLNPDLGKSINYDCFEPLVVASIKKGVTRFIYASSSSVYGVKQEPNVTELASLEPLTDYSKYKALCEEVLLKYKSENFCPVILRPATVCGYSPRQRFDLVVNILTNQAINNKEIKIFGGDQYRPNIHIDDVVQVYMSLIAVSSELISGEIFNAGSDNMTVTEIAETIRKVLASEAISVKVVYSDDNRSYRINSNKIMRCMGIFINRTVHNAVSDLRKKFDEGAFTDPLNNSAYFNIKRMQELNFK